MRPLILLAASLLALSHVPASAAPVPSFNAFVFNDFLGHNSDSEGRLVVGGSVVLSSYSVDSRAAQGSEVALIAGGNVSLSNAQANGAVVAGGAIDTVSSGTGSMNPNQTSGLEFVSDWKTYYSGLSASYGSQVPTGAVEQRWSGLWLTNTVESALAVFDISASLLTDTRYLSFSGVTAGQGLVLNIHGASAAFSNLDLSSSLAPYSVLINFVDALDVSFLNTSPTADVLAPMAVISGANGHIEGSVVAGGWDSQLELHNGRGDFLSPPAVGVVSSVSEPSSFALAVVGFLALGLHTGTRKLRRKA